MPYIIFKKFLYAINNNGNFEQREKKTLNMFNEQIKVVLSKNFVFRNY